MSQFGTWCLDIPINKTYDSTYQPGTGAPNPVNGNPPAVGAVNQGLLADHVFFKSTDMDSNPATITRYVGSDADTTNLTKLIFQQSGSLVGRVQLLRQVAGMFCSGPTRWHLFTTSQAAGVSGTWVFKLIEFRDGITIDWSQPLASWPAGLALCPTPVNPVFRSVAVNNSTGGPIRCVDVYGERSVAAWSSGNCTLGLRFWSQRETSPNIDVAAWLRTIGGP